MYTQRAATVPVGLMLGACPAAACVVGGYGSDNAYATTVNVAGM